MSKSVKEATYAAEPTGWDLSELLPEPSEEVISARLAAVEEAVAELEEQRANLDPEMDPALVVQIIQQVEDLVEQVYVLGAYGSLWFSADTQSADALTYRNRMMQIADAGAESHALLRPVVEVAGRRRGRSAPAQCTDLPGLPPPPHRHAAHQAVYEGRADRAGHQHEGRQRHRRGRDALRHAHQSPGVHAGGGRRDRRR